MMTASTRSIVVTMLSIGLAFTLSGCAKRPALAAVAAPAPSAPPAAPPQAAPPPVVQAPPPAPVAVAPPPPAPAPVAPVPPPAPVARPAPAEFTPNEALRPVHFDFDKSDVRPVDVPLLEAGARWLMQNPGHLVLIEGHTDPRGTTAYNLALGERRARSAQNFLVSRGVAANRVQTVSYGEERPLCHDENDGCWARNRRAMFLTKPR